MSGFKSRKISYVNAWSLDRFILKNKNRGECWPEFIKLDCQGAAYDVLLGAEETLRNHCVALWLEVEFLRMYKKQKTFSEITIFLRDIGFQLYGFYPHYISAKKLDRTKFDTEERIMWADAVYFKDPLSDENKKRKFSTREIAVLILVAILTRYYDFALEVLQHYYIDKDSKDDRKYIQGLILSLSETQKRVIQDEAVAFINALRKTPEKSYLLTKKFIDRHRSNNSLDYITL